MNMQVFLEWFHRLDAFVVGVALLVLAGLSVWQRRRLPTWLPWLSCAALLLVAVQGGLGALTVLALLPSAVVTAHLAVALLLVALLSAASQQLLVQAPQRRISRLRPLWIALASLSLLAVLAQCLLGGAMATQWATRSCLEAATGCQWLSAHRHLAGIAAAAVVLQSLAALALRVRGVVLGLSLLASALVAIQVLLGLGTLQHQLSAPLLTVAHQIVAALLVGSLTASLSREWAQSREMIHG